MIGVLIFAGIVGYAIVYSGLGDVQGAPVSIRQALLGKGSRATAADFPKPSRKVTGTVGAPRVGRKP